MGIKQYNVSQRAEAIGRAAVKRMDSVRTNFTDATKMLVFAVVRRAWAQGYRTALQEVRKNYYSYSTDSEGTVELIHPKMLDEFLKDFNRLK